MLRTGITVKIIQYDKIYDLRATENLEHKFKQKMGNRWTSCPLKIMDLKNIGVDRNLNRKVAKI